MPFVTCLKTLTFMHVSGKTHRSWIRASGKVQVPITGRATLHDIGEVGPKHVVVEMNVRFRTGSAEIVSAELDDRDILSQEDDT